ncbi:MAG: tetratricopeptide repeat protein [Planctomycetota bacterium]|nr:tetratricopeptide repeat protein [Planctomycetota bacterium]
MEVWQKDYPKDPQPYFSRGLYEAHAGNHQEAIVELSKGVELAPRRDDIRRTLAKSLLATQQFDEAETQLRDLLRRQPRNVESLTLLGSCLLEQAQLDEARTTLAKALEIDPTDRQARLLIGRVELKAGHPELAIEWLEPVVKDRPYEFDARFQFGTALQQAGRGDEAVEHLQFVAAAQTALARVRNLMIDARNDPDNAAARLEIGLTLLKYESPEAGANWLRNVLELDPDNSKAHAGLADYYDQLGDHDRAVKHREKANLETLRN